jgi:hypothetical protein
MRSSTSLALIALALGATAMALPMDSYTDLAERDESLDLETRMFETEDLDARDYDWEDELAAREESTTPTETTPTPASPAAGEPSTSVAAGGRKHRHHKGKHYRLGHAGHRKGKGRRYRKHRHGRKGAKHAALKTQENPAPPSVSTEASPALAAREPEPFSLFGLGKKKHTKVEETTPSSLKANSTSDPEPATPSASTSGTPKKKHRKHRKHRKHGKNARKNRKHRKHGALRRHKHKLEEPAAANATTSAV